MFPRLLIRIVAIFLMIGLGFLARRLRYLDGETTRRMAGVLTNFFYPCLIFSVIVGNFTAMTLRHNLLLPGGAFLIMAIGYGIGILFSKRLAFSSPEEKNNFRFQCTINNYSFLPLPLVLLLWGETGAAALILSSLGSEVAVWTLGILALTGNRLRAENLRHLASIPMLALLVSIATLIVIGLPGGPQTIPPLLTEAKNAIMSVLEMTGKATIPLAMFIAGSRMAELGKGRIVTGNQICTAALRLLVIPAAAVALLFLLPLPALTRQVLCVVAIMPSAIASVVLNEVYGGNPEFAASSVLVTHLIAILTIPAWLSFLLPALS